MNEKKVFLDCYAQELAEHFGVASEGLHGRELINYTVTEVLLRADASSVEMMRIMREATAREAIEG